MKDGYMKWMWVCAGDGRAGKRLCGVDELVMDRDMVRCIGYQFPIKNIDKRSPPRTPIVINIPQPMLATQPISKMYLLELLIRPQTYRTLDLLVGRVSSDFCIDRQPITQSVVYHFSATVSSKSGAIDRSEEPSLPLVG